MDGESRKRQILEYARILFARRGYESTSLAQIAKECSCSPSLLIRHFGSKENVYEALLQEYEEECRKPIIASIPDGSMMEKLEKLYNTLTNEKQSDVYASELYTALQSRRGSGEQLMQAMLNRQDVGSEIFLPILREGVSEGALPPDYLCEKVARILWIYITGACLVRNSYPDHAPLPFSVVRELIIEI